MYFVCGYSQRIADVNATSKVPDAVMPLRGLRDRYSRFSQDLSDLSVGQLCICTQH